MVIVRERATMSTEKKDRVSDDARRRGARHYRSYLTEQDVTLMRELHDEHDMTIREIAVKFDCPWSTARDIVTHKTWRET